MIRTEILFSPPGFSKVTHPCQEFSVNTRRKGRRGDKPVEHSHNAADSSRVAALGFSFALMCCGNERATTSIDRQHIRFVQQSSTFTELREKPRAAIS